MLFSVSIADHQRGMLLLLLLLELEAAADCSRFGFYRALWRVPLLV